MLVYEQKVVPQMASHKRSQTNKVGTTSQEGYKSVNTGIRYEWRTCYTIHAIAAVAVVVGDSRYNPSCATIYHHWRSAAVLQWVRHSTCHHRAAVPKGDGGGQSCGPHVPPTRPTAVPPCCGHRWIQTGWVQVWRGLPGGFTVCRHPTVRVLMPVAYDFL